MRPFLRIIEDSGGCRWGSSSKSLLPLMKASAYYAVLNFCSHLLISPPEISKVLVNNVVLGKVIHVEQKDFSEVSACTPA